MQLHVKARSQKGATTESRTFAIEVDIVVFSAFAVGEPYPNTWTKPSLTTQAWEEQPLPHVFEKQLYTSKPGVCTKTASANQTGYLAPSLAPAAGQTFPLATNYAKGAS